MPTLPPIDTMSIAFIEAQENIARIDSCKRHHFPTIKIEFGAKVTCSICGGVLSVLEVRHYILGYAAAGGNPNDILQGW